MAEQYDVVVIGSGPAGRAVAVECNQAGLSVAIIEDYGFGGTCPLRGCEPKKVLVEAANVVARASDMAGHGLTGTPRLDWPELMRFNRSFVDPVSQRVETWLDHEGIATYFGKARFVGPQSVQVDDEVLEGQKVVICTGAMPRPLNTPGHEYVASSDDFISMMSMPGEILFMGGGFISFELGHLAARAGARVTILEVMDRPLAPFDQDLVKLLISASEELGLEIMVNCPVTAVEKIGDRYKVTAGPNGEKTFEADMVVHGAGRVPALMGLNLDLAGVEAGPRGVTVNEYMQSVSNPNVYAAGDCAAAGLALTPVASMEAATAAHNIIHGNSKTANLSVIPSAVFTYPPLATVGLKEEDAQRQGLAYRKIFKETSDWSEHKRIGLKHSGFKVLLEEGTDRIIGAHIFGERSEEVINVFALAMRFNLTVANLKEMIWAYPSFVYTIRYMLA